LALLSVEGLTIAYEVDGKEYRAVNEVGFSLEEGESLALVGESGSGKSTLGLSLMGLLPANGRIKSGSIRFAGKDLVGAGQDVIRSHRWKRISMVFQSSMNALDPILTIKRQFTELLNFHEGVTGQEAERRIVDILEKVELKPAVMNLYPHEMSGGMKERAVIALALILGPDLLIADEPTTALDVTTQAEIITRLKELIKNEKMSMIFITHDLSLVPHVCKNVVILYGGTTMEKGGVSDVFSNAMNPYTKALLESVVTIENRNATTILGDSPTLRTIPSGCPFHTRCKQVFDPCYSTLPQEFRISGRMVRCHLYDKE
jgi:peptide/nickel transport system ATP-binding protein